ncbi:hypothetical protein AB0383_29130 [Amycolatopsis sp. NPDC051373]|uniref:hypothetical protein n=1 Tax=Amycolatopsis sp. NPDC051373 TaxID=3155801 RepID=UPI00344B6A10
MSDLDSSEHFRAYVAKGKIGRSFAAQSKLRGENWAVMAKHAYVAYRLTVTKLRKPDEPLKLGNFDGRQTDILELFNGFLNGLKKNALRREKLNQYISILRIDPKGRAIEFDAYYGRYGSSGSIIDTTSGQTTHQYDEEESPVQMTRNLIASPKDGTWAIFLAERYSGRGAATALIREFKQAFRSRFEQDKLIVNFDGLVDSDAWAQYVDKADMKEMKIKRFGPSSDIADPLVTKSVGRVTSIIQPRRGQGSFPRSLREKLVSREITAQEIIGIPVADGDEVELALDDGRQQRSILLGEAEHPILSYVLAEDDDERPTNAQVRAQMVAKVSEAKSKLGLTLAHDWEDGQWSGEALEVKLEVERDG